MFLNHYERMIAKRYLLPGKGEGSPSASPEQWFERTMALQRDDTDAYLLCCTNIRAIPVIRVLEQALQKPVITSNQTMVWHCLRKAGITDAVPGYGMLLAAH